MERQDHDVRSAEQPRLTPEEFRAVFQAAPDGIVVVDREGRIREVNPRVEAMFGWERKELLGREVEVLVPEATRSVHRRERDEYAEAPRTRPMGSGLQLEARRKDGSVLPVEISLSPIRPEGALQVIAVIRDITQRLRLRGFSSRTLRAAEEERRRLSHELFDDTAQRLVTSLLRLRGAVEMSAEGRARILERVREEIQDTVDGIRRIARTLRPPAFDEVGLATALRSHLREMRGKRDVGVNLVTDDSWPEVDRRLDSPRRLALYRVVQEAVSNTVRHAGATSVTVTLKGSSRGATVVVEDHGVGFDVPKARQRKPCLGLLGMEERLQAAGGRFEIESSRDEGTRVVAEVPVADPDGAAP